MIFITATKIEAEPIIKAFDLKAAVETPFPCYTRGPHTLAVSGIGKANSAMCGAWLAVTENPRLIINIGAAGAVRKGIAIGDIFQVEKIYEPDRPLLFSREKRTCAITPLPGFPCADLSTMDRPVLTDEDRAEAAGLAHIVDMEGAGFAQACRRFKITPVLFKYVTDIPGSHERDIIKNIKALSGRVSEFVLSLDGFF